MPIEIAPGRLDAPGLIELDAATGTELRRIDLAIRQPSSLWSSAGTLWLAFLNTPLARLDVPPR